jgi:hypothetical protein
LKDAPKDKVRSACLHRDRTVALVGARHENAPPELDGVREFVICPFETVSLSGLPVGRTKMNEDIGVVDRAGL